MPTPMNQLFEQIHNVPTIPEIVKNLIAQLNDNNVDLLSIIKNVEKEQVIALKVLRLVNSAHFGLSRKVNSIEEATKLLGLGQLKILVISSGIVSTIPNIENFDIKQFWNNSFRCAAYAKWFAEQLGDEGDIAYTAGLLSSLGKILIQIGMPKEANEIEQHVRAGNMTRSEIELKRLGYTNQDVCAELCKRWKLGEELVEAIVHSKNPLAASSVNALAGVVFLANFVSDAQRIGLSAKKILEKFPVQEAEQIGLTMTNIEAGLDGLLSLETNMDFD